MFTPFVPGATQTYSATTTTGAKPLLPQNPTSVLIYNVGTAVAFFKAGDASVEATSADTPIGAGQSRVFDLKNSTGRTPCTHLAVITGTGTATVYATTGQGGS